MSLYIKMKNSLIVLVSLTLTIMVNRSVPVSAEHDTEHITYSICTRDPGSRVNLRTGPGTNYAIGLEQVGSGGIAVDNAFRQLGYSLSSSDLYAQGFQQYDVVKNEKGEFWSSIGTNQWNAWVRSDFVCPS
jgi:hypothetical protein